MGQHSLFHTLLIWRKRFIMFLQKNNELTMKLPHQKNYSRLNLFLRSFIFLIYSLISIVLYSFAVLLSFVFPLRYRYALIRSFLQLYICMLKWICHIDYQVEGLDNIPKGRTGIILSKHQSTWETFYLPLIF